jgi:hypothetical protein
MRCSKCGAENPDRAKFCEEMRDAFHASMRVLQHRELSEREVLHRMCEAAGGRLLRNFAPLPAIWEIIPGLIE